MKFITGIIMAFIFVPVYQKLRLSDTNKKQVFSGSAGKSVLFVFFLICDCMVIHRMTEHGYKLYAAASSVLLVNSMLILAQTDIGRRIIPNRYLAALLVLRTVFLCFSFGDSKYLIIDSTAGLAAGFLITLIMSLLSKKGLGAGDIKMFAVVGYFAGLSGILDILLYTCLFCFICAVIFLITGKCSLKSSIPMAPFAFAGSFFYFAVMI